MTPYLLNLLICQGSDFNDLTFQLAHKCLVRCAVSSSEVPATIKIEPMGVSMSTGSIIISGCDDLVLAAPLAPNDRFISVTSIPSSLPLGSVLQGPNIDITGWQIRGSIKDKVNLLIANFIGVVVNALEGKFKLTLTSTVTSAIRANCEWKDYQNIDISLLGQPLETLGDVDIKQYKKLNDSAYKWDFETIDTAGIVTRRGEGLALVSGEVTT